MDTKLISFSQLRKSLISVKDYISDIVTGINNQIENIRSDSTYTPIDILSFTSTPSLAEIGSVVSSVELQYSMNQVPNSLLIDEEAITPSMSGSVLIDGQSITSDKTWILTAEDNGSTSFPKKTVSVSASLEFANSIYYGVSNSITPTQSMIKQLAYSVLSNTKSRSIDLSVGNLEYIWYAVPKRLGKCLFSVSGVIGGFEEAAELTITNSSNYSEGYYVYRSSNYGLGEVQVIIQ